MVDVGTGEIVGIIVVGTITPTPGPGSRVGEMAGAVAVAVATAACAVFSGEETTSGVELLQDIPITARTVTGVQIQFVDRMDERRAKTTVTVPFLKPAAQNRTT